MDKLFEQIKEFTYDIVGYILPGVIVMYIGLVVVINNMKDPIYVLFTNIEGYSTALNYITNINIIFLFIASYIVGHIISFISILIGSIIDKITINKKEYIEILEKIIINSDKEDEVINLLKDEEDQKTYILTKASTYSRFEEHNDLIQKYIYKSKLYSSMSCIFIILTLNCLVVVFNLIYIGKFEFIHCMVLMILLISSIGFYKEFKRHKILRKKESYMYLINKINK